MKGLSNKEIERALNFDWDVSNDEECGDELANISTVLEKNLEVILERGENIEVGKIQCLKNLSRTLALLCFEKIVSKTLQ